MSRIYLYLFMSRSKSHPQNPDFNIEVHMPKIQVIKNKRGRKVNRIIPELHRQITLHTNQLLLPSRLGGPEIRPSTAWTPQNLVVAAVLVLDAVVLTGN